MTGGLGLRDQILFASTTSVRPVCLVDLVQKSLELVPLGIATGAVQKADGSKWGARDKGGVLMDKGYVRADWLTVGSQRSGSI